MAATGARPAAASTCATPGAPSASSGRPEPPCSGPGASRAATARPVHGSSDPNTPESEHAMTTTDIAAADSAEITRPGLAAVELPIEAIAPHPANPRDDLGDLDEL